MERSFHMTPSEKVFLVLAAVSAVVFAVTVWRTR
jgi:hypothetical protein